MAADTALNDRSALLGWDVARTRSERMRNPLSLGMALLMLVSSSSGLAAHPAGTPAKATPDLAASKALLQEPESEIDLADAKTVIDRMIDTSGRSTTRPPLTRGIMEKTPSGGVDRANPGNWTNFFPGRP